MILAGGASFIHQSDLIKNANSEKHKAQNDLTYSHYYYNLAKNNIADTVKYTQYNNTYDSYLSSAYSRFDNSANLKRDSGFYCATSIFLVITGVYSYYKICKTYKEERISKNFNINTCHDRIELSYKF
jgi:hypothetical protein